MSESDLLQKPEYIHVVLNHLPIYGTILGALALAISLMLRSRAAQVTALTITLVAAASAYPVFISCRGLKPASRKFRSGALSSMILSASVRFALAKFLRVTEHQIKALELRQQFPILPTEWILRSIDWELGSPHRFGQGRAMYGFCPICIQEMSRRTRTVWIRGEWAFVFQTHCARHRTPLLAA